MLSRPQWRHDTAEFGQTVRRWLMLPDADSLMALAIFLDAQAVCGDAALLEQVRGEIFTLVADNDALLGRFAAAIDTFADSSGWWNRLLSLGGDERSLVNLKKAAIFPLVHGIRAMALEQHLHPTGTVARIEALVSLGKLPRQVGDELTDTLHFLMRLKLDAGLAEMELGRAVSGNVEPDKLSSLDRDLLKDAIGAVRRFKSLLRHRFHLDVM
jgi:CBS domain-containing protein